MTPEQIRQIEHHLRNFWDEQSLSVDGTSESVDSLVASMDSMTAVEALIEVEKIVGMELPSGSVIRSGGYDSQEQFFDDLTVRIRKYVEEHTS